MQLKGTITNFNAKQSGIRTASAKIKLIKELLAWSACYPVKESARNYPEALCKQLKRTKDKEAMIDTLMRIEGWCASRNELVHALMNKKVDNQDALLQTMVEEGEACNRSLQNFVKSFKNRNTLRKTFNIQ